MRSGLLSTLLLCGCAHQFAAGTEPDISGLAAPAPAYDPPAELPAPNAPEDTTPTERHLRPEDDDDPDDPDMIDI